jgi:iron complex transport system substrate-binding protein
MTVRTPVKRIVAMSTSYLPSLEMLGALDQLVGVSRADEVSSPKVRALIEQGKVKAVGDVNSFSSEAILALAPDVVFTFGIGPQDLDAYRPIRQAGIPVVVVAEYVEPTPLGRAEWVKFFSLFLDKESQATSAFAGIEQRYQALAKRANSASTRPTVLVGNSYRGTWFVPGGKSFMANFLHDAGAKYLWEGDDSTGVLSLDFESVFDRGRHADYWINTGFWNKLSDAVADDPRYAHFRPYREKRIFNNLGVGAQGPRDLWETGFAHPDRVLSDLVKIFHPELAADRQFNWYKKLD